MTKAISITGRRATALSAVLIFLLNAIVCRRLFRIDYLRYMGSIEGAYAGISRYMLSHHSLAAWFPLWYGGIPFQDSYPPLLHILVAGVAALFHLPAARAHHIVAGLLYCLGPVAVFLFTLSVTKERPPAVAAALLFSLSSPSAFVMPIVRHDIGSVFFLRRYQTMIVYGENPHVASITFLIFALWAYHCAVQRKTPIAFAAAAIAFASVPATNWLGAFSLALGVLSYLTAFVVSTRGSVKTIFPTLAVAAVSWGLVATWIPPSTVATVQRNARLVVESYPFGTPQAIYAASLLAALVTLCILLRRFNAGLGAAFSGCFLLLTAGIALSPEFLNIHLVPQPDRYHLEMEFGVSMAIVFAGRALWPRIPKPLHRPLAGVAILAVVTQFAVCVWYARHITKAVDITQTIEYQTGEWLQENLPGARVFAQGSVRFWLNAFADNPQLGGGFDQGIYNPENPAMTYGIPFTQGNGEDSALWMRLLGIQAVSVSEADGRNAYKDWRDPAKLRGVLPELWRNGGDVIYSVPQRSNSLAHAVRAGDVMSRPPVNVLDLDGARKLDRALSDASLPVVDLQWRGDSMAHLSGALAPDELLFVQISYHPGWRAVANSEPVPIRSDGLGFMVLEPRCNGVCNVDLIYDGGLEMRIVQWIRVLSVAIVLGCFAIALWRRASKTESRVLSAALSNK